MKRKIVFAILIMIFLSAIYVFGQEKPKEEPKQKTAFEVAQTKLSEIQKTYQELERQKYEYLGKYVEQLQHLQHLAQGYQKIIDENKPAEPKKEEIKK